MSSHSLLNRTSVASRSSTLKAWSWKVFALASISSARQHRPAAVAAAGVADPGRVVADDQHHRVPGLLELRELAQDDHVAEVDVGSRRVDAQLHAQRPPAAELLRQRSLGQHVLGSVRQIGPRSPLSSVIGPMLDCPFRLAGRDCACPCPIRRQGDATVASPLGPRALAGQIRSELRLPSSTDIAR